MKATITLRARAADFARWGEHGAEGWPFRDVLPPFKLLETLPTGNDAYHGRTGPLPIGSERCSAATAATCQTLRPCCWRTLIAAGSR